MKRKNEQREKVRFRVPTLVKYRTAPGSTLYQTTNIHNVSIHGMAFLTDRAIAEGAQLDLCFQGRREALLPGKGWVKYCKRIIKDPEIFKVGVRFEELPADILQLLSEIEKYFLEDQKKF